MKDFFISYAHADENIYINPLIRTLEKNGISFWLDKKEIDVGDSIILKINEGLRKSRYVLLCLSKNYIKSKWAELEMNSIIALQVSQGIKKVIPIIFNSKEEVLNKYPLLASFHYIEMKTSSNEISNNLIKLISDPNETKKIIQVTIESAHTDNSHQIIISRKDSVKLLREKARLVLGVANEARIEGAPFPIDLDWILVDKKAENDWEKVPFSKMLEIEAFIKTKDGLKISTNERDRLEEIGIYDGIVFHLYPIQKEPADSTMMGTPIRSHSFGDNIFEIKTTDVDTLFQTAQHYSNTNDYNEAIRYYLKILQVTPNDLLVLNNIADCLYKMKNYDNALSICNQVLSKDPKYALALCTKGEILCAIGKYKEAIESFKKFIKYAPSEYKEYAKQAKDIIKQLKKNNN